MTGDSRPIVAITGAAGAIGSALVRALEDDYRVVGFDLEGTTAPCDCIAIDLTSDDAVDLALATFRERYGDRIDSLVHLAAHFDFTGEEHPLYRKVNIEGTRWLVRALRGFDVGQIVYSGTMLVHAPCSPGERIDEESPIQPKWIYPQSKVAAEEALREEAGDIPRVILHLAALYDDKTAVPTLSQQIARIYERQPKGHLYAGDQDAGQAVIHRDDMIDAFRRAIDRRAELPADATILVGEPDPMSYAALQSELGRLIHGEPDWATFDVPKPVAKAGAWLQTQTEPIVPDDLDRGEKPLIRPFLIDMASDHYALDITRARRLLGWEPRHDLREELPKIVDTLKEDPLGWYRANKITPPDWMEAGREEETDLDALRERHEERYRGAHRETLWARFLTIGLGAWLVTAPGTLDYAAEATGWSDILAGIVIFVLGAVSLSWRHGWARWATAAVGVWLLFAPLVFWTESAAAYVNDTATGALAIGFSVLTRPSPGISPVAAETGPTVPPGWDFGPSSWFQRLLIILLAVVGFLISRYLAAYQLGHIDGVWEPFFRGTTARMNGTEQIITSSVSEAWPVSDAGVGAVTYMLEILTGMIGSARRWRTMPWVVVLFGIMIVPLGAVSITFIIIQPLVIGTWCTLCLAAAAAMLVQIPYSLDELAATGSFLWRRHRRGRPVLRIFFTGDTDDGTDGFDEDFDRSPATIARDVLTGGVTVSWGLGLSTLIGIWLLFTRITLGAEGGMAGADHLIGSLVITVSVIAMAEVARPFRFLNIPFGIALLVTPFAYDAGWASVVSGLVCGAALIVLSFPRGPIWNRYGDCDRFIV